MFGLSIDGSTHHSLHALSSHVAKMADDGRPQSARQVLEEIVQELRASDSLDSRESSVGTNTTLQAQTNSSSITSVSQTVARLFPSVGSTVT